MMEIRRGSDTIGTGAGERLPWLEPVEDEDGVDYGDGDMAGGYGGVLLAAIAVLIGIAVLTAVVVWWRHHQAATADLGQILHAPAEPYKVKPADPGGMKPDKNGEVTYGTSAGQDIDSPLDLSALPEQPIAKTPPAAAPRPQPQAQPQAKPATPAPTPAKVVPQTPAPQPAAAKPAPVAPADPRVAPVPPPAVVKAQPPKVTPETPVAAGPSATIQLGAFSTEAKASAVWKEMAQRFAYLRGLEKAVVPVASDGKTLYRLRASGAGAAGFCARLRVAGETCSAVGG